MNENPTICINCKHFSKANYSVALNKYWYHALCVHPDLILKEYREDLVADDKEDYGYDELYDEIANEESEYEMSASSLKKYMQCQLRYYFEYVKKIKIEEHNINMTFGTTIHKVLEHMNREVALGRE